MENKKSNENLCSIKKLLVMSGGARGWGYSHDYVNFRRGRGRNTKKN
jgi:hypothetical protein